MAENNDANLGPNTQLVHDGYDPFEYYGFVNPPVVHASTVLFPDTATILSRDQKYTYGTDATTTTDALANAIDRLEGSHGTIVTPSGLAAVTLPMLTFSRSGGHCLIVDSIYGPSRRFADSMLHRLGMEIEYFDPEMGTEVAKLFRDNTCFMLLESPGSNTFEMLDVPAIGALAQARDIVVMLDNTWATPLFFKPLENGVDISIHALTKYPNGCSDLVLGSISTNEKYWQRIKDAHVQTGICAQGDDCYATLRSMHSMGVRLERHQVSALKVANWLNDHPHVSAVHHPALPSSKGYELWKRDFKGASGLFSFVLDTNDTQTMAKFLDAMQLFRLGYSWGGYESLIVPVYLGDRTIAKGPENGKLIRLQIGLEDVADLIDDLKNGFTAAGFSN